MKTIDQVLTGESEERATDNLDLDTQALPDTADTGADTQVKPPTEEKPKGEPTPAAPPAAEHKEKMVPLSALEAERRRRQEAESRLPREDKTAPKPPPDVIEDPEGFRNHIKADVDLTLLETRVGLSEDFAKRTYQDFAEVMGTDDNGTHQAWLDLVKSKPHLAIEFRNSPNPALFAYEEVKRHKAMSDIGDPLTYKERIRAELKAELEAEAAKKPADLPVPDTLATEPSRAPRQAPAWNGPKPMKEILGKKRK